MPLITQRMKKNQLRYLKSKGMGVVIRRNKKNLGKTKESPIQKEISNIRKSMENDVKTKSEPKSKTKSESKSKTKSEQKSKTNDSEPKV